MSQALQYKVAECLGQHVSQNTQTKLMMQLLLGGLGISAVFSVGGTFLERYHLYQMNEYPSTHASEHGPNPKLAGGKGRHLLDSDGLRISLVAVWKPISSLT